MFPWVIAPHDITGLLTGLERELITLSRGEITAIYQDSRPDFIIILSVSYHNCNYQLGVTVHVSRRSQLIYSWESSHELNSDRNNSDDNISDPSLSLTGNTNTFKDYLDWLENYLKTLKLIFTCLDKIFWIQGFFYFSQSRVLQFTLINGVHCMQFTPVIGVHCSLPQSMEGTADDVGCNKCEWLNIQLKLPFIIFWRH